MNLQLFVNQRLGSCLNTGVEPKIVGFYPPKRMGFFMENPIKMDDLGVPLFLETPISSLNVLAGQR